MTVPSYISSLPEFAQWLRDAGTIDAEWHDRLIDADGAQAFVNDTDNALEAVQRATGRVVELSLAPVALQDALIEQGRLRGILEAFGALEEGDTTTGPLDLLEILLPPRDGDA